MICTNCTSPGGKLIVTEHGVEGLGKRRFHEALRKQTAEYLHYRLVWSGMRLAAERLRPVHGKPVIDELLMEAGVAQWREFGPEVE